MEETTIYDFVWLKAFVQRTYSAKSATTYMTSMNKLKGLIEQNDVFYIFNNPNILLEFIKTFTADNSAIIKHLYGVVNKLLAENIITKLQADAFKAATTNKYSRDLDEESEVDAPVYGFVDDPQDINTLPINKSTNAALDDRTGAQFSSKNEQSMNALSVDFKRLQDIVSSIYENFNKDSHDLAELIDINKKLVCKNDELSCKNDELSRHINNHSERIDILFELLVDDSLNYRARSAIKLLDKTTKFKK